MQQTDNTPAAMEAGGTLFVLSAPSGAGKTTLRRILAMRFPGLAYSVSHTTRPPREGEEEGKDYFFISAAEFEQGIKENQWAEWAKVHDNYYGTSAPFLKQTLKKGQSLLLDIDVQGAEQIMGHFPDAVTIFVMPPSVEELRKRLKRRGTDSDEVIQKRLDNAAGEMDKKGMYQYLVINDDLDRAADELAAVFAAHMKERP